MRRPGAGGSAFPSPRDSLSCGCACLGCQLPEWFVYCHRTILVNLDYVSGISQGTLELRGGGTLPVSRQRMAEIQQKLLDLLRR